MQNQRKQIMLLVANNAYDEATLVNGKSMDNGQGRVNDVVQSVNYMFYFSSNINIVKFNTIYRNYGE